MAAIHLLAVAPTFVKGILAIVCALILFVGSVYVLVSAVFGLRMGYLVIAVSFFAWMIIFTSIWAFGAPGTLKNVGPRGTEAHWQVFAASTAPGHTLFPESVKYPGPPWHTPPQNDPQAASIPTVTTAFQVYLAAQAQSILHARGQGDVIIDPTMFVIEDVKFATAADGTHLAAATGFLNSGGPGVTLYAYHDTGNVPIWSWLFFFGSIIGFLIHLPFLDRAEKSRKAILTGGVAPAWYGPA